MKHSILKADVELHRGICASLWYCESLLCSTSLLRRKITFIFDSGVSTALRANGAQTSASGTADRAIAGIRPATLQIYPYVKINSRYSDCFIELVMLCSSAGGTTKPIASEH